VPPAHFTRQENKVKKTDIQQQIIRIIPDIIPDKTGI
jgi:hypothetical protein